MNMKMLMMFGLLTVVAAASGFAQKQAPPEAGTPKDFKIPAGRSFTLDNGLAVTLIPYGKIPKTTFRFIVRTGGVDEPAAQVWISSFVSDFLKEGTASLTSKQIAEAAAGMGGEISSASGDDTSGLSGTVLSEFAPDFLKLLAGMLQGPKFPESELPRIQADYLRRIAVAKSQPGTLAQVGFLHVLYGDHPYGRLFPTEAAVKGYTIAMVRKFYDDNYGAKRTRLYIAGVFDDQKIERAVRESLGNWRPGTAPVPNIPAPKSKRTIYVLDRPGSVQSTIYVGLPAVDPTHKDFIALQVADSLLGGSFGSRITANIRENKGYTYSPGSVLDTRFRSGHWYEQADVSTDVTGATLKEIFFEIDRLAKEPPPAVELKGIQNNFAGIFVLQNSSPGGIIGQLGYLELHGLPRSYLDSYIRNVFRVTPAEVGRIVRDHLRAKDMTIYIVGDRAKIKDQLAPYGTIVKDEIK